MVNTRDTVRMPDDSKLEKAGYHMALSVAHKIEAMDLIESYMADHGKEGVKEREQDGGDRDDHRGAAEFRGFYRRYS
ncbi:MAG: hypothetical protein LUC17_01190 [Oscillospiraceae bacterium]|nr:hypothetical protein [Oscillospiraceae bacterium]